MLSATLASASDLIKKAESAYSAAQILATIPTSLKDQALRAMAAALQVNQDRILAANQQDLAIAAAMVESGELSVAAYARLKLDPVKVAGMIASLQDVVRLPDPVGKAEWIRELDHGLILERRVCPVGVLGVIFESRPDAVTQIASLAIKTGNSVMLKGGKEALNSCRILTDIMTEVLAGIPGFPVAAVQLLTTRQEIQALLSLNQYIDLIIPRGSKSFVQMVQANTSIPVLGHADGICHLYLDPAADLDQAVRLTVDSKVQYPSACNAIETLLVHQAIAPRVLPLVSEALRAAGVELRGCELTRQWVEMAEATETDWATEYGELILSIKVVPSLEGALQHIRTYGSRHTEAIVTEDPVAAQRFLTAVDAAGVFHNASTRFADGYRYGFGAEVGISTQKLPPRGPVGIEGLVTYKYCLQGQGQIVADYTGAQARPFTHRELSDRL